MKSKSKFAQASEDPRQAEAEKTNRLRALRLAKEAADRETAARLAEANPPKSARRSARPLTMPTAAGPKA